MQAKLLVRANFVLFFFARKNKIDNNFERSRIKRAYRYIESHEIAHITPDHTDAAAADAGSRD
jgi:hypothetical protein